MPVLRQTSCKAHSKERLSGLRAASPAGFMLTHSAGWQAGMLQMAAKPKHPKPCPEVCAPVSPACWPCC